MPITPIDQRPVEVLKRPEPGHWEGDCIGGAYNRCAIGALVEPTFRYTILLHLDGESRARARPRSAHFNIQCPPPGGAAITHVGPRQRDESPPHRGASPRHAVYLCDPGMPGRRPTNDNLNRLRRDYFPKGTNLRAHTAEDLQRASDELNRRPRKALDWNNTPRLLH